LADGTYRADVRSQPTDGKANDELIRLVSELFGCARSQVSIKAGSTFSLACGLAPSGKMVRS
jgi:uncharacterized protein YggU (UPF0235/DUF167 family)